MRTPSVVVRSRNPELALHWFAYSHIMQLTNIFGRRVLFFLYNQEPARTVSGVEAVRAVV